MLLCSQPSRTSLRRPLKKRPFLTAAPRVSSNACIGRDGGMAAAEQRNARLNQRALLQSWRLTSEGRIEKPGQLLSLQGALRQRRRNRAVQGQVRDCFGLFGEDGIRIQKPTWSAWDHGKIGTSVFDPGRKNCAFAAMMPICWQARESLLSASAPRLGRSRLLEELALVIAKLRFIEAELQRAQRAGSQPKS